MFTSFSKNKFSIILSKITFWEGFQRSLKIESLKKIYENIMGILVLENIFLYKIHRSFSLKNPFFSKRLWKSLLGNDFLKHTRFHFLRKYFSIKNIWEITSIKYHFQKLVRLSKYLPGILRGSPFFKKKKKLK